MKYESKSFRFLLLISLSMGALAYITLVAVHIWGRYYSDRQIIVHGVILAVTAAAILIVARFQPTRPVKFVFTAGCLWYAFSLVWIYWSATPDVYTVFYLVPILVAMTQDRGAYVFSFVGSLVLFLGSHTMFPGLMPEPAALDNIVLRLINFVFAYAAVYTAFIFKHSIEKDLEQAHNDREHEEMRALTDALTEVYNVRYLNEYLDECHEKKQPVGLILLDMDNFKEINDAYGHTVGNDVMVMAAQRIQDIVRDGDLVIRYGGDEFCIILEDHDAKLIELVAERIREAFSARPFILANGDRVELTFSGGCASSDGTLTRWELINAADQRCYEAKAAGKNRIAC